MLKILRQEPQPKSYRSKQIDKFLEKHFPYTPIKVPTDQEIKAILLRKAASLIQPKPITGKSGW